MSIAPRRRWPRFTLRTLFVVVTLSACWLGYNVHWIRQRRAALAQPGVSERLLAGGKQVVTAPFPINWLGERGVPEIDVRQSVCSDIVHIRKLFPEAGVYNLVPRTFLGVVLIEVPMSDGVGVQVRNVADPSPAAEAKIQVRDSLISFDGNVVTSSKQLTELIRSHKPGDRVAITVERPSSPQGEWRISAVLGEIEMKE